MELDAALELFSDIQLILDAVPVELYCIGSGGFGALANRYHHCFIKASGPDRRFRLKALVHLPMYVFVGCGIGFFLGTAISSSEVVIFLSLVLGALWPYIVSGTSEAAKVMAVVRQKMLLAASG